MDVFSGQIALAMLLLAFVACAFAVLLSFHSLKNVVDKDKLSQTSVKKEVKRCRKAVRRALKRIRDFEDRVDVLEKQHEEPAAPRLIIRACGQMNACSRVDGTHNTHQVSSRMPNRQLVRPHLDKQNRALFLDLYYTLAVLLGGELGSSSALELAQLILKHTKASDSSG